MVKETEKQKVMEKNLPENQRPLSYKEWALYIFLTSLPLVGFILLLVWAFTNEGNVNRREFARGYLLLFVIALIIVLLFLFLFGGMAILGGLVNR